MYSDHCFSEISRHIWNTKYRYRTGYKYLEQTIEDSWLRIAEAASQPESEEAQSLWTKAFFNILKDFRFLPGGRIQAGAGTIHQVTLFNCFVMGIIEDSIDGIFDSLKEGALTMQEGGGVGYDFSTIRPRGTRAHTSGTIASGPVSFMKIWDSMCATMLSTGVRRGAMMATLRCDHPDILEFIMAKHDKNELRNFNLSVQVTDDFMKAVETDDSWNLVFPATETEQSNGGSSNIIMRQWTGNRVPVPCRIIKKVRARDVWDSILRSNYDFAEPGVLFIDRINHLNNLSYREQITSTNPCGEIPLPPYGACNLGSINLVRFIHDPFTEKAQIDLKSVRETVETAVRLLDNIIDISIFPLKAQAETAAGTRRIGLGITGLADALIMLGLHYGKEEARNMAGHIMKTITYAAYQTSIDLARQKGPFPFFEKDKYLESPFIQSMPDYIVSGVQQYGIRNSHLLSIAPTGTISLLANNVSSGIEPVFDFKYKRKVLEPDGSYKTYPLTDFAYNEWLRRKGTENQMPEYFVDARHISPFDHLRMQAALQPYVDNAISKTINVPISYPYSEFQTLYDMAFNLGLKGCTTFRPNQTTGAILESILHEEGIEPVHTAHCCDIEREAD